MRDQRHCVQRTGRRDQRHVPEHGVVALTIGRVARPRGGVSRPMPPDTKHVWSALLEVANVPFRTVVVRHRWVALVADGASGVAAFEDSVVVIRSAALAGGILTR
jgi:hypothetical protein